MLRQPFPVYKFKTRQPLPVYYIFIILTLLLHFELTNMTSKGPRASKAKPEYIKWVKNLPTKHSKTFLSKSVLPLL